MSTDSSRRRLNEAIGALHRFARSRKLAELHAVRAGIDLNMAAFDVLNKAVEHGPMPASRLASQTQMAPNALSRQLRLLEDGGYIDRRLDRTDARVTIIEATPRGHEASQRLHEANDQMLARQLRNWQPAEIDDLTEKILRLVADLRRAD